MSSDPKFFIACQTNWQNQTDAACSWASQRLFSPTGLRAGAAAAPLPFSGLYRKENERGRGERRARGRKAEDKVAWVDLSLFLALQGRFPTKSSSKSRRLALFLLHPMFKFFSLGISFLPMSVHLQFVWVQNIDTGSFAFLLLQYFFLFCIFFLYPHCLPLLRQPALPAGLSEHSPTPKPCSHIPSSEA